MKCDKVKLIKESKKVFPVSITQEDRFFVAMCPELGVTSQGESLVGAQRNLKEAIELYIESFAADASAGRLDQGQA